jgi:hypothetical protein
LGPEAARIEGERIDPDNDDLVTLRRNGNLPPIRDETIAGTGHLFAVDARAGRRVGLIVRWCEGESRHDPDERAFWWRGAARCQNHREDESALHATPIHKPAPPERHPTNE